MSKKPKTNENCVCNVNRDVEMSASGIDGFVQPVFGSFRIRPVRDPQRSGHSRPSRCAAVAYVFQSVAPSRRVPGPKNDRLFSSPPILPPTPPPPTSMCFRRSRSHATHLFAPSSIPYKTLTIAKPGLLCHTTALAQHLRHGTPLKARKRGSIAADAVSH